MVHTPNEQNDLVKTSSKMENETNNENIQGEKNKIVGWLKEHQRELRHAGLTIGTLILLIASIRNKEELLHLFEIIKNRAIKTVVSTKTNDISSRAMVVAEGIRNYTPPAESFLVRGHIRNLPNGGHASAEKAAEAMTKGIKLLPNQTIVGSYIKGTKLA